MDRIRTINVNKPRKISCSSPSIGVKEMTYVKNCLSSGWITQGKYVRKFEESFAQRHNAKHAIACSSGTAALHLSMLALGLSANDAVIVPALTYIATANAARYCGASVYLADVDLDSWCIDPDRANAVYERAIREDKRCDIVIPVDLYDAIACKFQTWDDHNIVRDSSHSPGALEGYDLGLVATYSFYGSKVITCGEGGMVVTSSDELAARMRLYRGQGAVTSGEYGHSVVGYNYRMTDVQAAIGLAQLERLDELLSTRREIIDRYRNNLAGVDGVILQGGARASGWSFAVVLRYAGNANEVRSALGDDGIETRPFFVPIHRQPAYASSVVGSSCPVAESIYRRGICLPTHCQMTMDDVDYVCEKLSAAVERGVAA